MCGLVEPSTGWGYSRVEIPPVEPVEQEKAKEGSQKKGTPVTRTRTAHSMVLVNEGFLS